MKEKLSQVMHWELEKQAMRINAILIGHYNYYGLAGNNDRLQNFFNETVLYWRHCLSKRNQRGRLNWVKMKEAFAKYQFRNNRIRVTYQDLASYVRL
jgi:RNA-directed DNA polymerase